jgi:hypothetical protein
MAQPEGFAALKDSPHSLRVVDLTLSYAVPFAAERRFDHDPLFEYERHILVISGFVEAFSQELVHPEKRRCVDETHSLHRWSTRPGLGCMG